LTAYPDRNTADRLAAVVQREMRRNRVPGLSLAVTRHDRLLHPAVYGFADIASQAAATPRTAYLWFSMSKIATATVAMAAAEAGHLDLDAPVREYCPATRRDQCRCHPPFGSC
jgi:CubicO group peptidase (beta-lactamase class C family)